MIVLLLVVIYSCHVRTKSYFSKDKCFVYNILQKRFIYLRQSIFVTPTREFFFQMLFCDLGDICDGPCWNMHISVQT